MELCATPAPSRRRLTLSNRLSRYRPSSAGKATRAKLDRRAPLHRHELVAAAVLGDEAVRRERRMIEGDPRALGASHVEELLAGLDRLAAVHVEHRLPVGVAHEQSR